MQTEALFTVGPVDVIPKDVLIIVVSTVVLVGVGDGPAPHQARQGDAGRRRQPRPRRVHGHRRQPHHHDRLVHRRCARHARRQCSSALSEQVNWLMGNQLLLLVFAARDARRARHRLRRDGRQPHRRRAPVTCATLWIVAPELKNVGALLVMILILMIRPQGIFGRQGTDRVAAMDWWAIISNTLRAGVSHSGDHLRPGRHRPQPALRLHRPAQLRPGRRSWRPAPTASASRPYTLGWPLWLGILVGLGAGVLLGAAARRADAATARRLPRDRHHRRRRDHPPHRARRPGTRETSRVDRTASTASPTSSRTWNSSRPVAATYGGPAVRPAQPRVHRRRPLGDDRRLGAGRLSACS